MSMVQPIAATRQHHAAPATFWPQVLPSRAADVVHDRNFQKIKWMMNRGTRVLWISMDIYGYLWISMDIYGLENPIWWLISGKPNRRCTVSSCARSSPAPLPTWPTGDEKTHDSKKRLNEHLQEITGFSKNTQKKRHTHTQIYTLNIIKLYIHIYIYSIYIDIGCSFLSGIDRGLFWYCATLHFPRLFAWTTRTTQRHQPHFAGSQVGDFPGRPIQWLFSGSLVMSPCFTSPNH